MLAAARAGLALLTLTAIAWQLVLHVRAGFDALNFFSYFTNLSNLAACGVLLATAFTHRASPRRDVARFLSVVNMAVVGVVFFMLLRHVDLGGLLPWINTVLHTLMPVAVVADWLVRPPASRLRARHVGLAMVFPLAYVVYVLLRGAATGWYPYPFLNPANVGGYGGVVLYVAGIAAAFLVTALLLKAVASRR